MAKYADYVKPAQGVDQELQQVQQKQRNIPESVSKKFNGKSAEDVMESYAELQALNSRQSEEIGKLRKSVDSLIEMSAVTNVTQKDHVTAEPDVDITVDDLYKEPVESISKVVRKESKQTADRIEKLEQQLVKREVEIKMTDLDRKFSGWKQQIASPEFKDWVAQSGLRSRMANAANNYDFDAANDLLELWYEKTGSRQAVQEEALREQQFRDATLETSSPASVDPVQSFSRHDIQEQRILAHHGNQKSQRWLRDNAKAINAAYAEGRITN